VQNNYSARRSRLSQLSAAAAAVWGWRRREMKPILTAALVTDTHKEQRADLSFWCSTPKKT